MSTDAPLGHSRHSLRAHVMASTPEQVAFSVNVGDELSVLWGDNNTGVVCNAHGSEICRFRWDALPEERHAHIIHRWEVQQLRYLEADVPPEGPDA